MLAIVRGVPLPRILPQLSVNVRNVARGKDGKNEDRCTMRVHYFLNDASFNLSYTLYFREGVLFKHLILFLYSCFTQKI